MTPVFILLRGLAGFALGVFFYGGLKLAVRHVANNDHPVLWAIGSAWIRFSLTITGFLFLMDGRWEYALIVLAGFTAGRFVCI